MLCSAGRLEHHATGGQAVDDQPLGGHGATVRRVHPSRPCGAMEAISDAVDRLLQGAEIQQVVKNRSAAGTFWQGNKNKKDNLSAVGNSGAGWHRKGKIFRLAEQTWRNHSMKNSTSL